MSSLRDTLDRSRKSVTFKMDHFAATANGFKQLNIFAKSSILDVTGLLDLSDSLLKCIVVLLWDCDKVLQNANAGVTGDKKQDDRIAGGNIEEDD